MPNCSNKHIYPKLIFGSALPMKKRKNFWQHLIVLRWLGVLLSSMMGAVCRSETVGVSLTWCSIDQMEQKFESQMF